MMSEELPRIDPDKIPGAVTEKGKKQEPVFDNIKMPDFEYKAPSSERESGVITEKRPDIDFSKHPGVITEKRPDIDFSKHPGVITEKRPAVDFLKNSEAKTEKTEPRNIVEMLSRRRGQGR